MMNLLKITKKNTIWLLKYIFFVHGLELGSTREFFNAAWKYKIKFYMRPSIFRELFA